MRTIDDLINELLELKKEHGNLEVGILNDHDGVEHIICAYDKDREMIVIY